MMACGKFASRTALPGETWDGLFSTAGMALKRKAAPTTDAVVDSASRPLANESSLVDSVLGLGAVGARLAPGVLDNGCELFPGRWKGELQWRDRRLRGGGPEGASYAGGASSVSLSCSRASSNDALLGS